MANIEEIQPKDTLKKTRVPINEMFKGLNQDIIQHKASSQAHSAAAITYSGDVIGAATAKQAIDTLKDDFNKLVANAGDGTKDTEIILARADAPTLGDRLDGFNAQLAETEQKLIYKADLFRAASINYGKVLFPPDFANVQFDLIRGRDGKMRHNYNLKQYDTGDITIYCDATAANDSKDGLTPETANRSIIRSLEIAAARPETNIVIVIINGGIFYRTMIPTTEFTIANKRITITTLEDDVYFYTANGEILSWSLSSGTSNVYEAARTNASGVLDLRSINRDEYDIPKPYIQVTTKAECDATEGSWFTDGTLIYVHTLGGIMPDNISVMGLTRVRHMPFKLINATLVIKQAYLLNGGAFEGLPVSGDINSTLILSDVKIAQSNFYNNSYNTGGGNGLEVSNLGLVMSFNTVIGYSNRDGFNYHYTDIPLVDRRKCLAFEYDCVAYDCGINDTNNNNNASTMHEGACVLRVGTWGFRTRGPIIADVNSSYSINYDCHTWDSFAATASNKVAWKFHTDGTSISEVGKAILVNCSGGGDVAYGLYRAGAFPTEFTIQGFRGADLYAVTDVTVIP